MVLRFFLLAAAFFFVSCSDLEFNNPYDPDSPNYIGNQRYSSLSVEPSSNSTPGTSSSSVGGGTPPSSPSTTPSSSSVAVQAEVIYGTPVTYGGETYQTVVIGSQTWMARNLNYAVEGSKCYGDDEANCAIYGRLYNWATAMDIDAKYNSEWWDIDEVKVNEKHKGICPSGWHIPSKDDWDELGSDGTKLKATSGWINERGKPEGNGTDDYGFSALPGGCGYSDGLFSYVGDYGIWWSASESNAYSAYGRDMTYSNGRANWISNVKNYLLSVRCVQD